MDHAVVRILDVDVDAVTPEQAVGMIGDAIDARRGHGGPTFQVATVNPEFTVRARRDPLFRKALRGCSLRTPDGVGLMLASRILGKPIPHRVPGVELVQTIAAAAAGRGDRVFLLGGGPGVAAAAADRLRDLAPGLQVAGTFAGSAGEAADEESLAAITPTHPDIILVAYGAPAQELWAARNLGVSGATVAVGVGGSFDFISGQMRRAPAWLRRAGLEWLYRLVRQPWRWRRQLDLPLFLLLVIRQRLTGR